MRDKKLSRAPRSAGVYVPPALDEYGNPRAWELWWVPLQPRRTIEEVREMGRARAVLEASSYGEPFMIATDLASMRVRMFDNRERKETFEATIQNQLPAYVEVDVATVSGLTASWPFEVSWATGPETRPRTEDTARNELLGDAAASGNDRAASSNGKDDGAQQPPKPIMPGAPAGTPGRSRVRPLTPIQPKPGSG